MSDESRYRVFIDSGKIILRIDYTDGTAFCAHKLSAEQARETASLLQTAASDMAYAASQHTRPANAEYV